MLEYLTLIMMVTSKNFLPFPCVKSFLKHFTFSQILNQKIFLKKLQDPSIKKTTHVVPPRKHSQSPFTQNKTLQIKIV
jgi:hypothetical protein